MRFTRRTWVALGLLAALAAITIWGPRLAITIAWVIAAIAIAGAALSMSPSVQLRGRVNRIDSGAGPPVNERSVKRP
jgi:O-antigen ligase